MIKIQTNFTGLLSLSRNSPNGGKDTEMFGEFLERESRRYSRRLDEEEEAKSL